MRRFNQNKKGQFSIIAALFVAVILISSIMVTYSTINYSSNSAQPQIMSAVDETNLALKQVLGFTVGYYGSILQVTGNSSYAYAQSQTYLSSGLNNIANLNPEWGASFSSSSLSLGTYWFTNQSYSQGQLNVTYSLPGLGVSGISYSVSCRLDVDISPSPSNTQVCVTVIQDGTSPLVDLTLTNFKFYQYQYSNSTWAMVNPPDQPNCASNGTYTVDLPSGISNQSFILQVQDSRGIIVPASSFSHYTSSLTFNSTTVSGGTYVNQFNTAIDGVIDQGTHSNFTAQQQGPDGTYDTMTEADTGTTGQAYHPSSYSLDGSTTLVSGTPSNLVSDDGVYMTFGSYASSTAAQTLYAHEETTTISSTSYYDSKLTSADASGLTLTGTMTNSRTLLDQSVYSLQGMTSIPASTWTMYYRASKTDTPLGVTADTSSSAATGNSGSTSISWSYTTGSGANSIMIVGVSINSASTKVNGITYGSQSLSSVRRDVNSNGVSSELWYLLSPSSGQHTITVSLSGTVQAVAGACTFFNVVQSAPAAGDQAGNNANSNSPSQSVTVSTANSYLIGVLSSTSVSVSSEGNGQNQLWDKQISGNPKQYGHGSDKGPVSSGSQSISWSLSAVKNWAMSMVVLKPAPTTYATGHIGIDILIRESNGAVRSTLASDVATSGNLGNSYSTFSASYSFSAYNVVSTTDYLEIDYYVDSSTTGSSTANLMIDNNSLALTDQTRASNVMMPSQYTCQAELSGSSNLSNWNNILWAIDLDSTYSNVNAIFQLYNYGQGQYPASGNGYLTATLGTTITQNNQNITTSPSQYRDAIGNWKIKFTVTGSTPAPFNINVDSSTFTSGVATYGANLEEQWTNLNTTSLLHPTLCIYTGAMGTNNLGLYAWNGAGWSSLSSGLTVGWNNISVSSYLTGNSTTFTIKFGTSGDTAANSWQVDAALLRPESNQYLFNSLTNPAATVAVELLQNGTMIWLGQNLQITTQAIPVPPVSVKAIHVNETINGVNEQVPFQVEDWASAYTVPLGLTNNATVFGNRQMIVFLVNPQVSGFTLWWNGSDQAVQTSLAYASNYFTSDNTPNNYLTNGQLGLQFNSPFTVTSKVLDSGTSSTTSFMQINGQNSVYGSGIDYVVYNGVVRDIVQQEAEWSGGITNCPNLYADIVLTLPANATYFTYQLSLMFINSTMPRTITSLCPLTLSSSIGTLQTENGTAQGDPIVASGTQTFSSTGTWVHHWSQFTNGNTGAGIMFTDQNNQLLYAFDSMTPATTRGALSASSSSQTISLLPVTLNSVSFQTPYVITWCGAVVTFDSTVPQIYNGQGQPALWLLAEIPPNIAITSGN